MKTLYEDLLGDPRLSPEFVEVLRGVPFVRADNVVDYILANHQDFEDVVQSFPTVMPPFPALWTEFAYRLPYEGQIHTTRCGYYIERFDLMADGDQEKRFRARLWGVQARWLMAAYQFYQPTPQMPIEITETGQPESSFVVAIDEDGTIALDAGKPYIRFAGSKSRHQDNSDLLIDASKEIFGSVLMTMALMHCKNVVLEEVDPSAKSDGGRRRRNRHEQPAVKYQVIKIRPMTRHTGTGEWEGGGAPSMHIRRGHFKDYRHGAGLFGRLNGLYWWESAVIAKGSSTQVDSSYEVGAPSNPNQKAA